MTTQGDHIVLKCSGADCGMRYPSPADDHRRDACPLCEAPTEVLGVYAASPVQATPTPAMKSVGPSEIVGVLDNIRSAQNVGTMLRSADGAALDHVYLGGLTAPVDNPKVWKTALGAQSSVATTSFMDTLQCVYGLRERGFEVWAVDFTNRSESLESIRALPDQVAFVVGNELAGVDPEILRLADRHVHLTMSGTKTTVNVGVAFGIVAYQLRMVATCAAEETED